MKNVARMLAASPTLAQIVPENKGYVLSAQDPNDKSTLLIYVASSAILLILGCVILYRRKQKRHYRSR
jgi:hypothetical protein